MPWSPFVGRPPVFGRVRLSERLRCVWKSSLLCLESCQSGCPRYHKQPNATADSFCSLYDELEHFLNMPPVAPMPLPHWLLQKRHESRITASETAESFITLLAKQKMLDCGYTTEDLVQSQA